MQRRAIPERVETMSLCHRARQARGRAHVIDVVRAAAAARRHWPRAAQVGWTRRSSWQIIRPYMARIYLSSTFEDLKDYRAAVYHTLRQMHHDVISMEDDVAGDERPLDKCLADVSACDMYLGIFALRYGFIPPKDNPDHKSITELEYRRASADGKERLVFLLDKSAPWPQ